QSHTDESSHSATSVSPELAFRKYYYYWMHNLTIRQNRAPQKYEDEKVSYKHTQSASDVQHIVHYKEIYSCCSMSSTTLSATGRASLISCSNFSLEQSAGKPLANSCKSVV